MKTPAPACPVQSALQQLTGKWRLLTLFRLGAGPLRFNALQRALSPVTQKVLTATLRGLEDEGLVWRHSEASVPPQVSYGLTARGQALGPVFDALARWQLGPMGPRRSGVAAAGSQASRRPEPGHPGRPGAVPRP